MTLEMTVLKMAYAPELVDLAEIIRRMDSGGPPSDVPKWNANRSSRRKDH